MEFLSNLTDPLTLYEVSERNESGRNASKDYFHPMSQNYVAVWNAQTVLLPPIFLIGVIGNCLAIGCFVSRSLRSASCCLYMAAKCTSDTVFLATLFVTWLYRVHVGIMNMQGVCQLTVFLSYVSGFVSVWLVLAITYENYIRICCPCLTKIRCTRRVALTVTSVIVTFAVLFYSFALWTTNVLGEGATQPMCMSLIKFKDVLMVMTFIDTVITLVLPSLIIVPLVIATLVAVFRSYDRKNRLHDSLLHKATTKFNDTMEAKVAKFLLSVSLTFILLHTPAHLIRLKQLVHLYILHLPQDNVDTMLQRLFETFYYFNFCCSVVIFLASGANFRAIFLAMYCGNRCGNEQTSDRSAITLSERVTRNSCENYAFTTDPEIGHFVDRHQVGQIQGLNQAGTNEMVCFDCKKPGHKKGSPDCRASSISNADAHPTEDQHNTDSSNQASSKEEDAGLLTPRRARPLSTKRRRGYSALASPSNVHKPTTAREKQPMVTASGDTVAVVESGSVADDSENSVTVGVED